MRPAGLAPRSREEAPPRPVPHVPPVSFIRNPCSCSALSRYSPMAAQLPTDGHASAPSPNRSTRGSGAAFAGILASTAGSHVPSVSLSSWPSSHGGSSSCSGAIWYEPATVQFPAEGQDTCHRRASGSSAALAGAVSSTPVPQFAFPDARTPGGATASASSSAQATSAEEIVAFIALLNFPFALNFSPFAGL